MCRAVARAAWWASAIVTLALLVTATASVVTRSPLSLMAVGGITLVLAVSAVVRTLLPLRRRLSDRR
ncbi:MAG TPA: hypothetical protein VLV86_03040, partial [Vicinamibacterales bacterium]|nr:hypothetical protein [Vicinamibacterales bacterium]